MANFTIITDAFFGTPGPDWFLGTGGGDNFRALGGNDRIEVTTGTDFLDGGDGNDTFVISHQILALPDTDTSIANHFGTSGKDILRFKGLDPSELRMWNDGNVVNLSVEDGGDVMLMVHSEDFWGQFKAVRFDDGTRWTKKTGFEAIGLDIAQNHYGTPTRDTVHAMGGDDFIWGGDGRDRLYGGADNDTIHGQNGHDRLFGGSGVDVLQGMLGNDRLWGGAGDDQLYGHDGRDVLRGGGGHDKLYGQDGNDKLFGGSGNDNLQGLRGNDVLYGLKGDDQLSGGDDDDLLFGGSGNDQLAGGTGDDMIVGGKGNDVLLGSLGVDTYVFNRRDGHDRIMDYAVRDDVIDLSNLNLFDDLGDVQAAASREPHGNFVVIYLSPKAGAMAHTLYIVSVTPEQLDELTFLF
ncbi:MAG: hypothetical protein CML02_03700 [Pseudooceanicola sp.]|nr:hypothetical protein [Pseudooceanicola sp.]